MPTLPIKDSLNAMVDKNPVLGAEMLEGAVNALLAGEVDDGRILLRQYINATIGFKELAKRTKRHDKNLMRSLSASGNPTAANLFEIIRACSEVQGVAISAHLEPSKVAW